MTADYMALRHHRLAELDPETREIYDATAEGLHVRQLGVDGFRDLFAIIQGQTMIDQVASAGISTKIVNVPTRWGEIPTKIYMPEVDRPLGAFVHTHAGGWIAGRGFDMWDGFNFELAATWGCAVVHPDFDLPPERKFPIPVDECFDVFQWTTTNAGELGLDAAKLAVGGGCTGANLAAVVAVMARDAELPLAAQYLFAPQMDCRTDYRSHAEFAKGYGLAQEDDEFVIEQYLNDPEERWDWRASPVLIESARGLGTAVFAVGEYEILRDGARLYANRLNDAGVPTYYFEGKGQGHGHTYWRNVKTGRYTRPALLSQGQVNGVMRQLVGAPELATNP